MDLQKWFRGIKVPKTPFVVIGQFKVIQGHGSNGQKTFFLQVGAVIHVFRSVFRQEHENFPLNIVFRKEL